MSRANRDTESLLELINKSVTSTVHSTENLRELVKDSGGYLVVDSTPGESIIDRSDVLSYCVYKMLSREVPTLVYLPRKTRTHIIFFTEDYMGLNKVLKRLGVDLYLFSISYVTSSGSIEPI